MRSERENETLGAPTANRDKIIYNVISSYITQIADAIFTH